MLSTKQHRDKKWNPYSRQLAHSDEAYPGFLSMKQIGVLQLPSRGILVNHIVTVTKTMVTLPIKINYSKRP